ncbi:hypothetical protein CIHG_07730 [Coccidioides immitis H538.4]|uniref:Uncharacterized protein n=3 Tax=Coccidioides immitis TaxID=5501 RepID=A0A0J8QUH8_COCIT|nr:hypothetical protein CIRG_04203 [Coccidioides immitis RMSCC 2394]KMU76101.1 hypothetical protein CISG_05358 [Coccidioides immitis RMSCC 3703]KMU90046.1 hypothetical protein CIHG_07730 [Coccidioides immitis H538.4]
MSRPGGKTRIFESDLSSQQARGVNAVSSPPPESCRQLLEKSDPFKRNSGPRLCVEPGDVEACTGQGEIAASLEEQKSNLFPRVTHAKIFYGDPEHFETFAGF